MNTSSMDTDTMHDLLNALELLDVTLCHLYKFVDLNRIGFQKILKKFVLTKI